MLRSGLRLSVSPKGYFSLYQRPPPRPALQEAARSFVSCKSDRAWRQDLKAAGLRWTLTDLDGVTSHYPAVYENVSSPLMAESLACRAAVMDAVRAGVDCFLLESDSQKLVGAINTRFSSFICRFIPDQLMLLLIL